MTAPAIVAVESRNAVLNHLLELPSVSADRQDRVAVSADRSGSAAVVPLAVARPGSVREVQEVVRRAWQAHVPIVARGAGTGMAGGAIPTEDAIVLDLSRLNKILDLDPTNRIATVEPGVITADLDAQAALHGLRYAPDPASAAISTIGGNIATNAGGLRCLKYGVTRDAVRSLDIVLADGSLLHTGTRTLKSSAGYDLTRLFVGSEGTLGIVVGATVSLKPIPVGSATALAAFRSISVAARAVEALAATGVDPAVLELVDAATVTAIERHVKISLGAAGAALLLVRTEGYGAYSELEAIRAVLAPLADSIDIATDEQGAERLLAVRRAALPAIEALGPAHIEDICVPIDRLAEAIERIGVIGAAHGVRVFTFAHAGDGNVHPIIVGDQADAHRIKAATDDIFALALDLGGTITGEHGVGSLKRDWLGRELSDTSASVHHAIRAALDPRGLLNPGKALPSPFQSIHDTKGVPS
jgi:glycolate oxidase